ncbi:hypothetical protein H6P81_000175 [Aristolochia fimbriata]|uniref:Uncharacterized protein n=1 Tax=Aristolochia fimbriata TaxID=158543 RepID=A0AAV7F6P0_ARIFI|nr:hypothetical protein H6P81_000175 [Aristolochia fimbriata]
MEGHPCDPASTNWTFAFFEEVHHRDPEDQSGYFFRLDAKTGVPMRREFPLIIDLGNWTNVGFSSNGYLFYRSCVNPFDIDSADRSPIPVRCYVANYFTNQTMVIPSPPVLICDIHYSVVALYWVHYWKETSPCVRFGLATPRITSGVKTLCVRVKVIECQMRGTSNGNIVTKCQKRSPTPTPIRNSYILPVL